MLVDARTLRVEKKTEPFEGRLSTDGLAVAVRPIGAEVERVTVPANPLRELTCMLVRPAMFACIVIESGDMKMRKSFTFTVTVTVWDSVPFVPVTDTMKLPDATVFGIRTSPDVPVPPGVSMTVVRDNTTPNPAGTTVVDRCIVPENPLKLLTVIVALKIEPALRETVVGLALIEKSRPTMVTFRVTVAVSDPLAPLTLTV